ncbi:MAG: Ig-like domain-containing protein [Gemmatimonadota bacterium]
MRSYQAAVRYAVSVVVSLALLSCGGGGGDGTGVPAVVAVASVEVSPSTVSVEPGGSTQLSAIPKSSTGAQLSRTVTWSSDAPAIASVTQTGLVSGVADGTATITATAEGRSGSATVTVRTPVASVVVTPPNVSMIVGGNPVQLQAATLGANGTPLQGRAVTWTSSNPAAATVSQTGLVTSVAVGTATITATSEGRSGTATVTVAAPDPCQSSRPITVGQTLSGTLASTDCRLQDQTVLQAFRFTLNAAATLEIQMTSAVVDAYLFVLDGSGNVIAEDDDGGSGTNARVMLSFAAGQYTILANTFDPNSYGAFQLTVAPAPQPCVASRATVLPAALTGALAAATSCRLNDDRLVDLYDITISATSTVRVDMSSAVIDPFLVIFDAAGQLVAQDDDAGAGFNARIEVQLQPGRYLVVASAQPAQVGPYGLNMNVIADPCAVTRGIGVGQSTNSTLTSSDCAVSAVGPIPFTQRWLLVVPTTMPLQIDMTSAAVDAYLILQDAATGQILVEADDVSQSSTNARITANFPPGQYIVNATTFNFGEVGPYNLSALLINPTTPISVAVTPNAVTLSAGQTQQLTATVSGNANTAVTWESLTSAVAVVSTTGVVRAITPGSATILARSVVDPSKTASATVTVTQAQTGTANLDIAAMYIVQSVQQLNGSVKLVENRDAVARVFLRGSRTGLGDVSVRVRVFQGATLLQTFQATVAPTLTVSEGCCSANILIPGSLIRTGVSIVADVDPQNAVTESNEADNSFPLSGTPQLLNVTTVSDFNVRLVPVRQNRSGLVGSATTTIASLLRSIWPLSTVNVTTRQAFSIDYTLLGQSFNEWSQLVRDLELARRAEVTNSYYYGVVRVGYTSGVLGLAGGIPALSAVGIDEATPFGALESRLTFAHEMGHAIGLRHAPCGGAAGPDPAYPFPNAETGTYGMDIAGGNLIKTPTATDIMSYCDNQWVSVYNYNNVMDQRARFPNGVPAGMISPTVASVLMITGAVDAGQATIDASFAMDARPSRHDPAGRFVVEGFGANGKRLFSQRFSPFVVSDARPDDEGFVVAVPVDSQTLSQIVNVSVREVGGRRRMDSRTRTSRADASLRNSVTTTRTGQGVRLTWSSSAARMLLVREPRTGEIIGVSRNGALDLSALGAVGSVELLVSDGVSSVTRVVNAMTGALVP